MKKNKRKIIIGIISIVVLIILMTIGFGLKFKYETSKMKPLETQEIISGIYAIKNDYVNFYVIKKEKGYIVIDAGVSLKDSENELSKLGINEEDVTDVFLTHTDYDHSAVLKLFKNATVYISEQEEQMINKKTHRQMMGYNKLEVPYKTVKDGEKIKTINREVQGILTPGHTPGSMSYLVDGKYLFTGDTLSLNKGKVERFNTFFNMDSKQQEASLHQLADTEPAEYIFTGHYGYTNDYVAAFEKW